jgi:hypothetical protein
MGGFCIDNFRLILFENSWGSWFGDSFVMVGCVWIGGEDFTLICIAFMGVGRIVLSLGVLIL